MQALTKQQRTLLARLEEYVEKNLHVFLQVGIALTQIHNEQLYREVSPNFNDYTRKRFGIGRAHAHRLMRSVIVVENLKQSPRGDTLPTNEMQTRALVQLPADVQGEVWSQAVDEEDTSPARLRELADQALAGLTTEEKKELIENAEKEVIDEDRRQTQRDREKGRGDRCAKLIKKLRTEMGGYGHPAKRALGLIDKVSVELEEMRGKKAA
jgi:hypothetical protein